MHQERPPALPAPKDGFPRQITMRPSGASSPTRCAHEGDPAAGGREDFRQPQRNHRLTPSDDELLQKTTLHHLERESPNIMFIENYTNYGFSINGNTVVGPCAILPHAILQWNVGTYKDIIPDSLTLFCMLEPKIEIVVLGTGAKVERLDPDILKCLQQRGIAVEVQSTPNACATFNFLVSERRVTAAGLIPPPPGAMFE